MQTQRVLVLARLVVGVAGAADLRIGIIRCDPHTSSCSRSSGTNPPPNATGLGGNVVAAFRGGNPDIPDNANRLDEYSKHLQEKYGVKFYDPLEELG